MTPATSGAAT